MDGKDSSKRMPADEAVLFGPQTVQDAAVKPFGIDHVT